MQKLTLLLLAIGCAAFSHAQPLTNTGMSTAGNPFTVINPRMNNLVYNADINAMVFVHRTDQNRFPSDDITHGNYRYDLSTNLGAVWSTDLPNRNGGLNPLAANGFCRATRYPQTAIYNPSGNTNINNAYMVYMGAYHDGGNCGGTCANGFGDGIWDGIAHGVIRLDGDTNTITESYTQINGGDVVIAAGLTQSKPGTFFSVIAHAECNATDSGIILLRGDWDNIGNDVNWTVAQNFPLTMEPTNSVTSPNHKFIETLEIAFDPSGRYGWISCIADLDVNAIQMFDPVFYYTDDSGSTWNGPISLDLDSLAGRAPSVVNQGIELTARMEGALTVDANGHPHMLINVYPNVSGLYAIYNGGDTWMDEMFLCHLRLDSIRNSCHDWTMQVIDTVHTLNGVIRGSSGANAVFQDLHSHGIQSEDGNKIFFSWTDTDPSLGTSNQNTQPDLKMIGYDLGTDRYTPIKNWTDTDPTFSRQALWPSMSTVAYENSPGTWNIPTVLGSMSQFAAYDDPVDFDYISNINFVTADFSIDADNFGPDQTLIGADPIFLNVGQSFVDPGVNVSDCTDNTGSLVTSSTNNVNTGTKGTYTVQYVATDPAGNSDTITRTVIVGLQSLVTSPSGVTCVGDSLLLTAQAFGATGSVSYVWNSSTNVVLPTAADSAVYVIATNSNGQIEVILIDGGSGLRDTNTVSIAEGFDVQIAEGDTALASLSCNTQGILNALFSGDTAGKFFQWSNTSLQHQIIEGAGTYWVTAQASSGCQVADTAVIVEDPLNTPSFASPATICQNKPANFSNTSTRLSGNGWNATWRINGSVQANGDVFNYTFPNAISYTVTLDVDSGGCSYSTNQVINVTSSAISPCNNPLVVTIGGSTNICTGDTASLSVNVTGKPGPFIYLWTPSTFIDNPNSATPKIYPNANATYSVLVTDGIDSLTTNVNIVVSSRPTTTLSVSPDTLRCDGGPINISAPGTFVGYNWSNGTNGVALIQTSTTGDYYVIVDDGNCTGPSDTVSVVVSSGPTKPVISLNPVGRVCSPDSVTLSVPAVNNDYHWSNGDSGQNSTTVAANGFYELEVFDQYDCSTIADSVEVYITPVVTGNLDICAVQYLGTTNSTIIVWDTTGHRGIEFYQVQSAADSSGPFTNVGIVVAGEAPILEDAGASSTSSQYYRIQAIDSCGGLIASNTSGFNTINLTVNRISADSVELSWTGFTGFPTTLYRVFSGTDPNNLSLLTVISAPQTTLIDLTPGASGAIYYRVEVSGPLSCSADSATYGTVSSNVSAAFPVSIGTTDWPADLLLFPNPTAGLLQLEVPERLLGNAQYLVTEIGGKVVVNPTDINSLNNEIDLSQLASGTYFVHVTGAMQLVKKIVLQR